MIATTARFEERRATLANDIDGVVLQGNDLLCKSAWLSITTPVGRLRIKIPARIALDPARDNTNSGRAHWCACRPCQNYSL